MNGQTIAWAAVLSLVLFSAVTFGWRSWLQWRRTGSTGFRGISGRVGSAEWFGGVLLVPAFALAFAAPIAAAFGAVAAWSVPPIVTGIGAGVFVAGFAFTVAAQLSMGDSWRIGVDQREQTKFISRGLFRVCRNPIFSGMLAVLAGLFLLVPGVLALLAFATALAGLQIQVRLVEEPYLARTHGKAYVSYAARVGRFVPVLGRWKGAGS